MNKSEKAIYLTFDDGPHPILTPFVLDLLKKYDAKATFFCIGKNVKEYPEAFARIVADGHSIGNHTFNHLNGKKTTDEIYINDVEAAQSFIKSKLFRPPYGSITGFQVKLLTEKKIPYLIIMWTVLSGDFDVKITKERCLQNIFLNTGNGSIVVFHDSDKAAERMQYTLPVMLKVFNEKGFSFKKLEENDFLSS